MTGLSEFEICSKQRSGTVEVRKCGNLVGSSLPMADPDTVDDESITFSYGGGIETGSVNLENDIGDPSRSAC